MRSSVAAAELEWPRHRITVNLAPAGLRKEGSGFDLPIALAVLAASRQIPPERLDGHAAVGELALAAAKEWSCPWPVIVSASDMIVSSSMCGIRFHVVTF